MTVSINRSKKFDISVILTFIVIYVSNDTLLFGTNANRNFFWVHVALLLMTFVYLAIKTKELSKQLIFFTLVLAVMMVLTQAVNRDTEYIKYIYNIFVLALCLLFSNYFERNRFFNAFVGTLYYIALFAIIFFVLWNVASPMLRRLPGIVNESGMRFYFYGLGFLGNVRAGTIQRMYGIFREPGVFACYLALAMIIQLFFIDRLNIKRVLVLAIAAVLTFSTAAYIVVAVVLIGYFLKQAFQKREKRHEKVWTLLAVLLVVLSAIVIWIGPERIMNLVFNKLKATNSSRDSRFGSIEANLRMFLQNPILGKGWNYVELNFSRYAGASIYQGNHNTNTFLKILALYGIVPFSCIFYGVYRFFRRESKAVFWGLFLTAMWMVALSNEDFSVNILFYLLPMYGIKKDEIRERACGENTGD